MKRRDFLKWAGAGILVIGSGIGFVPQARQGFMQMLRRAKSVTSRYQLTTDVDVFNLHQVITSDITNSRTIMWQSRDSEDDAVVEYRQKGETNTETASASNENFTDDDTTSAIHTAVLTDLNSYAQYEYRVGNSKKRTDWHPLSTPADNDFKVLIFPDSQCSDYSVWGNTAMSAWKANQDASFFINMGDLVDNGEDHTQWDAWFNAADNMIQTIPVAPLLGNHETYTLKWKVRMPIAYLHLFTLPHIDDTKYQNQYYAFDHGDVHFTVLNTQMGEMDQFQPDMLKSELAWLEDDLATTKKKWKIVLMHKDVLQYGFQSRPGPRVEGFSDEGKTFMPLFDKYAVDVVLTAHLHTYRNRGHIKNFKRDAKGPLYIITGVAGDVRYPNLWKNHSLDEVVAKQPETDNYMTLSVGKNSLLFSSFLPSGETIDTVSVTKG